MQENDDVEAEMRPQAGITVCVDKHLPCERRAIVAPSRQRLCQHSHARHSLRHP